MHAVDYAFLIRLQSNYQVDTECCFEYVDQSMFTNGWLVGCMVC
jgi:hypothetical protein